MDYENNERWLTDGNCTKCRRADYCSKKCSAHKRSLGNFLHDEILSAIGLSPIYNELNRLNERARNDYDDRRKAKQYEKSKNKSNRKGRAKTC